MLAGLGRLLRLIFFPPSSVRTRFCQCPTWRGETWGVHGGVMLATCKGCGERIPNGTRDGAQ